MPHGISKGYFGILTRNALASYQSLNGIYPPVGFFGPLTRAKVNAVMEGKTTLTRIPTSGVTTKIQINFSECGPAREMVTFGLGSTVFIFNGIRNGNCYFEYGTEIENPSWNGGMSHACVVPVAFGEKSYNAVSGGIVMDALRSHCSEL